MKYNNISRTLFGYKLTHVDSYGNTTDTFKLPKTSPFKLRPGEKGGFCFVDKEGKATQTFYSVTTLGDVFTGTTKNNTRVQVNIVNGLITPEYVYELDRHIVTTDGRVFKIDLHANIFRTPYLAPLSADGQFRDNRISEGEFVFKGPAGKYVVMDCRMKKVINMDFETPLIRKTFDEGKIRAYTVGNKHHFCDKKGNVLKSIDSSLEIYKFNSNATDNCLRFAVYDRDTNSSIIYAYDEQNSRIRVETTLNNRVTDRFMDNRRLLYVTQTPTGKVGLVNRLDRNLIPHIYDSISQEQLKPRSLGSFSVVSDSIFKVGITTDGEKKYGAYDMTGKSVLPTRFANIDLSESAKMEDGTYRFMVSNVSDYYGVVDSNGNTLVPLKYIHFPDSKTIVPQKTGRGTSIERLVLSRPNGQKAYFNIFADNILASEEEKKAIVTTYKTTAKTPSFATRPAQSIYGASFSSNDNDEMGE